jgi:hypothetical protein
MMASFNEIMITAVTPASASGHRWRPASGVRPSSSASAACLPLAQTGKFFADVGSA